MKTPHDDLEHDLTRLRLRELPAHWKDEILARAHAAPRRRFAPPRAVGIALAAAWLVILTLHALTPAAEPPSQADHAPVFAANSLFALNQHSELLQP